MNNFEKYVRNSVPAKKDVNDFINKDMLTMFQFDPEVGYILGDFLRNDGIDNSASLQSVQSNGMRTSVVYADRAGRINTYGNSFTQCSQVSDYETWQEYLAAHLGEPVRNFGVGGHGVYQAYRRILRNESTKDSAKYIILYIWGNDHHRSLLRSRFFATSGWHMRNKNNNIFHGTFWSHLEMDFDKGCLIEKEQLLNTPESLYQMTDPDRMVEALKDDLALQMTLCPKKECDITPDINKINSLAEILGIEGVAGKLTPDEQSKKIRYIFDKYALLATKYTIDKTQDYAARNNKEVMVVLSCPRVLRELMGAGTRYDQDIVDYLAQKKIRSYDMNLVHIDDFACFNTSFEDYAKRYWIGHYNPTGNHFFAYSIKNSMVEWLNPKPITYRDIDQSKLDFKDYLGEYHV